MKLTLNGEPVTGGRLTPQAQRTIKSVSALPPGECYTANQLAIKIKISYQELSRHTKNLDPKYTLRDGNKLIYGQPETLKAYAQVRGIDP